MRCPTLAVASTLLVLLTHAGVAQTPALIADVNKTLLSEGSYPSNKVRLGALVMFTAQTPATGTELFRTVGVAGGAGTALVKDIRPGKASAAPHSLTVAGSTLFFVANDGSTGFELFKSDGTASGTTLVKDIVSGSGSSRPVSLVAVGSTLFFLADDGVRGAELWKSDGTASGTTLVKDIRTGANGSWIGGMTAAGNKLMFMADDGVSGRELWRSDGTASGTVLVRDIYPGAQGSNPWRLVAAGTTVYFSAFVPLVGWELWKSDGTTLGTLLVKDVVSGTGSLSPWQITPVGNTVYFFGQNTGDLYKTDGSTAGTVLIKKAVGRVGQIVAFGSKIVFTAYLGRGMGVLASDGTAAGTITLRSGWSNHALTQLEVVGNTVWFQANNASTANQGRLWKTDGTAAGTVQGPIVRTDGRGSGPRDFVQTVTGDLLFTADDGTFGAELWVTDGTQTNTKLVKDLSFRPGYTLNSSIRSLYDVAGRTFFIADDGIHGVELWITDGTASGTRLVKDINPGPGDCGAYQFAVLGDKLVFGANDGQTGLELWVSDGTAAGTKQLWDIHAGPSNSWPEGLTRNDDHVFLSAYDGAGSTLWKTNGTVQGTKVVKRVSAQNLAAFDGVLYFGGADATSRDVELWTSDGTPSGTVRLKDINPQGDSKPYEFTRMGDTIYFSADHHTYGRELWKTNGTASGTVLVKDTAPGLSLPYSFTPVGNTLFFVVKPVFGGFGYLWKTDGTTNGTVRVSTKAIDPSWLRELNGKLLFSARNPIQTELWTSDGTEAGTKELVDLNGTRSLRPIYMTKVGKRRVWFSADDSRRGNELWVTDGSSAGTRMVADINTQPPRYSGQLMSSNPSGFTLSKGKLLFRADDGIKGYELWGIAPGATSQVVGAGCGPNGRVPTLDADDPVLGRSMRVSGTNAPANSVGVVLVGFRASRPIPLAGSCLGYIDPRVLVPVHGFAVSTPGWQKSFPVPNNANLDGDLVAMQTLFLGTTETTNALYLTMGR